MKKLRVLLADDHQAIRDGLKMLIDAQPDMEVVGEAGDGIAAWQEAKRLRPDVVLMDVGMPRLNGVRATEKLKQECPEVRVLALTAHEDRGYLSQLLKVGASGYVIKVAATKELINAIRAVAAGGMYLDPTAAAKVMNAFKEPSKGHVQRGDLTEREEEVLRLVAQGYTNKEIAARLDISVRTVETHTSNCMDNLDVHRRADILRYPLLRC